MRAGGWPSAPLGAHNADTGNRSVQPWSAFKYVGRLRPKPEPLRGLNSGRDRGFRCDLGAAAFVTPLLQHRHSDRLGTLQGVAESAVPGNVGHAAKAAADAEQDSVEVPLAQPVVP